MCRIYYRYFNIGLRIRVGIKRDTQGERKTYTNVGMDIPGSHISYRCHEYRMYLRKAGGSDRLILTERSCELQRERMGW